MNIILNSGSTGVACKNLNRRFIGIEKDENYFKIAENRIFKASVDNKNKVAIEKQQGNKEISISKNKFDAISSLF